MVGNDGARRKGQWFPRASPTCTCTYVFRLLGGTLGARSVATGEVIVVRYADDLAWVFQHRADAERFLGRVRGTGWLRSGWIAGGEDAADSVWAVHRAEPERAGTGQAGDLHLPRVHALLWDPAERMAASSCGGRRRSKGLVAKLRAITTELAPPDARAHSACRGMGAEGRDGLPPVPRDSRPIWIGCQSFATAAAALGAPPGASGANVGGFPGNGSDRCLDAGFHLRAFCIPILAQRFAASHPR